MLVKVKSPYPTTPIAKIPLNAGQFALCDPKWFETLNTLHWYAKKSACCLYACSKVKVEGGHKFLKMHRVVAHTPKDQICHHINKNPLDNREANLRNMSLWEHSKFYSYW